MARMDLHLPEPIVGSGLEWWHGRQLTIGWKGHLYPSRVEAGAVSAAALAELLERQELKQLDARAAGDVPWSLSISVHSSNRWPGGG